MNERIGEHFLVVENTDEGVDRAINSGFNRRVTYGREGMQEVVVMGKPETRPATGTRAGKSQATKGS